VRRSVVLIALVFFFVFVPARKAQAWGPATHVKLASDLLGQLSLLPTFAAGLLARRRRDYIFGNIAADVVIAKRLSRVKQFCHHWSTGFAILEDAETEASQAFALGYLSHLAADTVAHGKFLPRQMTLTRSTVSFGHIYWELRADGSIGPYHWSQLRSILDEVFDEHEVSLSSQLTDTFLPFAMNWRLFYRMNKFVGQRLLRRAMDRWYMRSRWQLSDQLLREYRAECLDRMLDVVRSLQKSPVVREDPSGNAALAYTRVQRRQLRQMSRAGLIAPHVLYEAAATHAPALAKAPLRIPNPNIPTIPPKLTG
jgi:hypothetical protein